MLCALCDLCVQRDSFTSSSAETLRERRIETLTLEEREQARTIARTTVGVAAVDGAALDEADERIVERHHPVPPSAFDGHRQLRRLAFSQHARDRGRVQQHLARRHASAADL